MAAPAWPQDPRRQRQVGRLQLRLPQATGVAGAMGAGGALGVLGAEPAGATTWRSRVEDALRCADLGMGQRLVMLRRVQVKAGSAAAPGWSAVVEAACREATRHARHGTDPAAARADAVWFADWDEAMGTWLETTLQGGNAAAAWFWPRVAWLAGWQGAESATQGNGTDTPANASARGGLAGGGTAPAAACVATARALLALWQSDPASQRAARHWLALHPGAARLLCAHTAAAGAQAGEASAHLPLQSAPTPQVHRADSRSEACTLETQPGSTAPVGGSASAPGASTLSWARPGSDSTKPAAFAAAAPGPALAPEGENGLAAGRSVAGDSGTAARASSSASPPEVASGQPLRAVPLTDSSAASPASPYAFSALPPASATASTHSGSPGAEATPEEPPAAPSSPPSTERAGPSLQDPSPPVATARAAGPTGWHRLRATRLGGLPLCLNAWERLGWAAALEAWCTTHAPGPSAAEISLRALAACSPWLAVWSRLPPLVRQALLQDPAVAALPVADLLPQAAEARQEALLLAHWQAAPATLRALGRQGWCRLNAGCQQAGWRGLRTLLWRPAWVQLSATHLDVVCSLQQVDLAVRRLGLDCDPGWLPWFGRIVQLHYEPAENLPAWAAEPSSAATDPTAPTTPRTGPP